MRACPFPCAHFSSSTRSLNPHLIPTSLRPHCIPAGATPLREPTISPRSPFLQGMSVLAYHHDGSLQYDTHNLYSLSEVKVTAEAVQSIRGKRPFVLTRWD